jgi:CMP/dCMP kinase
MTDQNSQNNAAAPGHEHLVVALDGPAGAGKSTVAKRVAHELGVRFLDTGAMYRAVTLRALELGIDPGDHLGLGTLAAGLALDFNEEGQVLVEGVCLEPAIRAQAVTSLVSEVSAHGSVRDAVVARQQELGHTWPGLVAEGRDTTTVVFKDAPFKFYMDASSRERAKRRSKQEGREKEIESIQSDIERRDHYDSSRAHSPLQVAQDAHVIDTDQKSLEEVVHLVLSIIRGDSRDQA